MLGLLPTFDQYFFMDLAISAPVILLSLTIHEYAHARTALAFGDPTAQQMGRVTLNPLAHLDLVGTLMMFFSGFLGWAKPVPVDSSRLRPYRIGDIAVSLAGVACNLVLAVACAMALRLLGHLKVVMPHADGQTGLTLAQAGMQMLLTGVVMNLGLLFFNLLPLYPLDGHHVVREMLPYQMKEGYMRWQLTSGRIVLIAMVIVQGVAPGTPFDLLGLFYRHTLLPAALFLIAG